MNLPNINKNMGIGIGEKCFIGHDVIIERHHYLWGTIKIGNNCTIKNSIILNDVHIGDNTYIENCIVESRGTIRANSTYVGDDGKVKIVIEKSDRYSV